MSAVRVDVFSWMENHPHKNFVHFAASKHFLPATWPHSPLTKVFSSLYSYTLSSNRNSIFTWAVENTRTSQRNSAYINSLCDCFTTRLANYLMKINPSLTVRFWRSQSDLLLEADAIWREHHDIKPHLIQAQHILYSTYSNKPIK